MAGRSVAPFKTDLPILEGRGRGLLRALVVPVRPIRDAPRVPRTWLAIVGLAGVFAFLGAGVTYFVMEREQRGESSAGVG